MADFVEELQAGWEQHDPGITNRPFANDVVWGSPFGATLQGNEQLQARNVRLKEQARGGDWSRYEVMPVLAPTPDVAVAQVRRVALDPAGHPGDHPDQRFTLHEGNIVSR